MFWIVLILILAAYLAVDRLIRLVKVGNYSNKHVFITGCDSGFGRELAIRLDKMGFPVFATCLTMEGRRSLEEICSSRLTTLTLNVTDHASIQQALKIVKGKLPDDKSLWAVVNNAGVPGTLSAVELLSDSAYRSTCDVNLFGPIEMSRVFIPLLRKSRGRLILMTSIMGRIAAVPAAYVVSKFGFEGYGDTARRDLSRFGIKVTMIEPGFFSSSLITLDPVTKAIKEAYDMADPDVQSHYGRDYVERTSAVFGCIINTCSRDSYKVVDAYVEALTSAYPRPRYIVGNDARFFFWPLSFMPEWISDPVLKFQQSLIK